MTPTDVTLSRRHAGQVMRYHAWPHIRQQSVGEHTWQVLCLYIELFGLPSAEVLYRILHHDSTEVSLGDPPFHPVVTDNWRQIKLKLKEEEHQIYADMNITLYPLTETERAKIKVADLCEMYEWGMHEWRLGNQFGVLVMQNVLPAAMDYATQAGMKEKIVAWFREKIRLFTYDQANTIRDFGDAAEASL